MILFNPSGCCPYKRTAAAHISSVTADNTMDSFIRPLCRVLLRLAQLTAWAAGCCAMMLSAPLLVSHNFLGYWLCHKVLLHRKIHEIPHFKFSAVNKHHTIIYAFVKTHTSLFNTPFSWLLYHYDVLKLVYILQ